MRGAKADRSTFDGVVTCGQGRATAGTGSMATIAISLPTSGMAVPTKGRGQTPSLKEADSVSARTTTLDGRETGKNYKKAGPFAESKRDVWGSHALGYPA